MIRSRAPADDAKRKGGPRAALLRWVPQAHPRPRIKIFSADLPRFRRNAEGIITALQLPFAPSGRNTAGAGFAGRKTMPSLLIRLATGVVPAAVFACALSLGSTFIATSAEARERPRGDWPRYCKDADIRGDWLEADCRKEGGGWRRNTRINFDDCPGNEVTVRNGYLVCERRYGWNGHGNWGHNGSWNNGHWDNDRWDRDRWDHNRYGWNDRRDWDRRDWDRDRHDHDRRDGNWDGRRDNDRRDWDNRQYGGKRPDTDRRDGNWNGRRDDDRRQAATRQQQQQPQWQKQRDDNTRREADRRDDNNRRRDNSNDRDEWWKRGNS